MKKRILIIVSIVLIVGVMSIALVACDGKATPTAKVDMDSIYAFSATTGIDLMTSSNVASEAGEAAVDEKADMAKVNKYVGMFDGYLSSGYTVTPSVSDKPDFATKLDIVTTDISGTKITKTMYFNETAKTTGEEVDDEERETFVSTTLKGVMTDNGVDYLIDCDKQVENEEAKDESEVAMTVKMTIYKDEATKATDYVLVLYSIEQETEAGESEVEKAFTYEKVVDGKTVEKTKINMENEVEGNEVEEEISLHSIVGGVTQVYTLDRETDEDGNQEILVKYTAEDGTLKTIEVKKVGEKYQYKLSDNTTTVEFDD